MNKEILERCISNRFSTRRIARELKCSQTNIRHWLKKYGLKTASFSNKVITTPEGKFKCCAKCNKHLTLEHFYMKNETVIYSWCKKCCNKNSYTRQKELKRRAVDYKGGKCILCGYAKYVGSLDFHHLDPLKKDFGISKVATCGWEKIKPELDKCILVCKNCHGEIHGKVVAP